MDKKKEQIAKMRISDWKKYGFFNIIQMRYPNLPLYVSVVAITFSTIVLLLHVLVACSV